MEDSDPTFQILDASDYWEVGSRSARALPAHLFGGCPSLSSTCCSASDWIRWMFCGLQSTIETGAMLFYFCRFHWRASGSRRTQCQALAGLSTPLPQALWCATHTLGVNLQSVLPGSAAATVACRMALCNLPLCLENTRRGMTQPSADFASCLLEKCRFRIIFSREMQ